MTRLVIFPCLGPPLLAQEYSASKQRRCDHHSSRFLLVSQANPLFYASFIGSRTTTLHRRLSQSALSESPSASLWAESARRGASRDQSRGVLEVRRLTRVQAAVDPLPPSNRGLQDSAPSFECVWSMRCRCSMHLAHGNRGQQQRVLYSNERSQA